MKKLIFTFEHKHCKCLRTGIGFNAWEAYKDAGISTAEACCVWQPVNVAEYYEI